MEITSYKCSLCGFIHDVPDYWASFSPDSEIEFEHIDFSTGDMCANKSLLLIKE